MIKMPCQFSGKGKMYYMMQQNWFWSVGIGGKDHDRILTLVPTDVFITEQPWRWQCLSSRWTSLLGIVTFWDFCWVVQRVPVSPIHHLYTLPPKLISIFKASEFNIYLLVFYFLKTTTESFGIHCHPLTMCCSPWWTLRLSWWHSSHPSLRCKASLVSLSSSVPNVWHLPDHSRYCKCLQSWGPCSLWEVTFTLPQCKGGSV
jgi:hypothetical protein